MEKNILLLTLKNIEGIGNITAKRIMDSIGNKKIELEELFKIIQNFPRVKINNFEVLNEAHNEAIKLLENIKESSIEMITYFDLDYPKSFLSLKDLPVILFYEGDIRLAFQKCATIVGTRKPSEEGRVVAYNLSKKLSKKYVIVSGLAEGIDIEAHKACIGNKGKTIAILGQGINTMDHKKNNDLCEKIITSGGLILSEYPPEQVASNYTFIARDRLQSALSEKVFVIESSIDGGTMHAAMKAREYNKELRVFKSKNTDYILPSGNSLLIQEGAKTFDEDY